MPRQQKIQNRGGEASTWTSVNPILAEREMGIETDELRIKFGDGVTEWNSLPYAGGGVNTLQEVLTAGSTYISSNFSNFLNISTINNSGYFNYATQSNVGSSGYGSSISSNIGSFNASWISNIDDILRGVYADNYNIGLIEGNIGGSNRTTFKLTPRVETGLTNITVPDLPAGDYAPTILVGEYNADTNTPTLANTDDDKIGQEWLVTNAGTVDFGAGDIELGVGDILSNDGSVYFKKVDNNQVNTIALESTSVSGTFNLDLDTFSTYEITLTGNTTITVSNTPTVGSRKTLTFAIVSDSSETLTLPATWNVYGEYDDSGVRNKFSVELVNTASGGLVVDCFINQPN